MADDGGLILNFQASHPNDVAVEPHLSSRQRWSENWKKKRAGFRSKPLIEEGEHENVAAARNEPSVQIMVHTTEERKGKIPRQSSVAQKQDYRKPVPTVPVLRTAENKSAKVNVEVKPREEIPEEEIPSSNPPLLTKTQPENPKDVFSAQTFQELGLSESLVSHMEAHLHFTSPTLIQKTAIPAILTGNDVLVKADTGTGKTLVYLAPIFQGLISGDQGRISRSQGTFALILAPTRELCLQIDHLALQLARRFAYIVPGHVVGGENRSKEKARLRKGVNILVATPGRLLDHLKHTSSFLTDNLKYLVLDEADRLLDLGFEKDLVEILSIVKSSSAEGTPKAHKFQTMLLSATLSPRVSTLASLSLNNPVTVTATPPGDLDSVQGSQPGVDPPPGSTNPVDPSTQEWDWEEQGDDANASFTIPSQLLQRYLKVPCRLRLVALIALLHSKQRQLSKTAKEPYRMLVFFSTCHAVDFHHSLFSTFQLTSATSLLPCPVMKLHGQMAQKDRTQSLQSFMASPRAILLCTDVAARGLDIPHLTCIVQYDPAGEIEAYVHRVGRTARLGQKGEAVLFVQPSEMEYVTQLHSHGVDVKPIMTASLLDGLPAADSSSAGRKRGRDGGDDSTHPAAVTLSAKLEAFVSSQSDVEKLATDAFRSFVRAYAAHKGSLKQIFHPKKLHLGHVAKCFGLKDAPSLIGQSSIVKIIKTDKMAMLSKKKGKKKILKHAQMS